MSYADVKGINIRIVSDVLAIKTIQQAFVYLQFSEVIIHNHLYVRLGLKLQNYVELNCRFNQMLYYISILIQKLLLKSS